MKRFVIEPARVRGEWHVLDTIEDEVVSDDLTKRDAELYCEELNAQEEQ